VGCTWKDVQAVIKVGAELPRLYQAIDVLVRGREDADVHRYGLAGSNPLEGLLLDDSEELRLELERKVPDLVEEDGPAVGQLEAAPAILHGVGKSPFHMAEEFAFEEAFGEGRAIHTDEGFIVPRALEVDLLGYEFLAYARFAQDKDR
jgi:hypothetical protein